MGGAGSALTSCLTSLLTLARTPGLAESRVHALNILRVLYRDARLGEAVAGAVEEGLTTAVRGVRAMDWAERTASTLLFSALVTRTFGVRRDKEQIVEKNCLTGKVFFQRYPGLHSFLLEMLKESQEQDGSGLQLDCSLYPILLLLARLYPSPTEEDPCNPFPLASFLPPVLLASSSPLLHTRRLAATALAALLPRNQQEQHALGVLTELEASPSLPPQNTLHGNLLTLAALLKRSPSLGPILTGPLLDMAPCLLAANPCSLTQTQYLHLCSEVISSGVTLPPSLSSMLSSLLEGGDTSPQVWRPLLLRAAARLQVQAALTQGQMEPVLPLLQHQEQEVRQEVMRLLCGAEPGVLDTIWGQLCSCLIEEHQPETQEDLLLALASASSPHLPDQALAHLLSLVDSTPSDEVRAAAIRLLGRAYTSTPALTWANLLHRFLAPEHPLGVRLSAARALTASAPILLSSPPEAREAVALLWAAALKLLHQDDEEMRGEVSLLLQALTGSLVAPEVAARKVVTRLVVSLGKSWPAATMAVLLATILAALEEEQEEQVELEVDRAFDRNEVNCYQEAVGLALLLLPPLSSYLGRLSPRLQASALQERLPPSLVFLLPELPGAGRPHTVGSWSCVLAVVMVVVVGGLLIMIIMMLMLIQPLLQVGQLLEYLSARVSSTSLSPTETLVLGLLFSSVRAEVT